MLKKGVPQVSVIIPAYNAEKYIEESQNTTRYVPPDTQAAMFYLTNRKPGEWKNRQDLNAKVTGELNLEDLIE